MAEQTICELYRGRLLLPEVLKYWSFALPVRHVLTVEDILAERATRLQMTS